MTLRPPCLGIFISVGLLGFVLTTIGCDTFVSDRREVIARNAEWTVTAVGDLDSSGKGFGRNLIRFEAARLGVLYASADLYEAGPRDHSFALRYESREWVSPNVLRLSHIPVANPPTVELHVRNESARTIRYLTINTTDELFLLLQLSSKAATTVPSRRWGDFTSITVRGVFENGAPFDATSKRFESATRRIEVAVQSTGVDISEIR